MSQENRRDEEILIIYFDSGPSPVNFSVDMQTYMELEHMQREIYAGHTLPIVKRTIEDTYQKNRWFRLHGQIVSYQERLKAEIAMYDRTQDAKKTLKGIFENI